MTAMWLDAAGCLWVYEPWAIPLPGGGRYFQDFVLQDGQIIEGTWEDIVQQMRSARGARGGRSLQEFMQSEARRTSARTGVSISVSDAESFIRGSADAGILRILG